MLTPATGGNAVTWTRTAGLPGGLKLPNGFYYAGVLTTDKSGRTSDSTAIYSGSRVIKVAQVGTASRAVKTVALPVSTADASADMGTISLRFSSPLDADNAGDASNYLVVVNGKPVEIESVGYNVASRTVTLSLPEGRLSVGDGIVVGWNLQKGSGSAQITAR